VTQADEHIYRYDISDPTAPRLLATVSCPDIGPWTALVGFASNPIPPGMPLHSGACAATP
jgi:hypothetical protein